MKKYWYGATLYIVLAIAGIVAASPKASAATITVDDMTAAGSLTTCNLRSAIQSSNTNTAVNGCVAGDPMPAVDTIQLGSGTYQLSGDSNTYIAESTHLVGISSSATTIDTSAMTFSDLCARLLSINNTTYELVMSDFHITNTNPDYDGIRLEIGDNASVNTHIHHVTSDGTYSLSGSTLPGSSNNNVLLDHVHFDGVSIRRFQGNVGVSGSIPVTVEDSYIGNKGLQVFNSVLSDVDNTTTIRRSQIQGDGSTGLVGVGYYNMTPLTRLDIEDSIVSGYKVGVSVSEYCSGSSGGGSAYVTNSMVGGGGMKVGVLVFCGHYVSQQTTYHDITGSAVLGFTNTYSTLTPERGNVHIESYNSTYTSVTTGGTFSPSELNMFLGEPVSLDHVVTLHTNIDPGVTTASGSKLSFIHNTFAGNTLGTGSVLGFNNPASLTSTVWRNNAMEGSPKVGNYTAPTNTVSDNLTTGTAQAGIAHVDGFVLGALADNGGVRPIGVDGANGHVLTLRPLWTSPLIDGAPDASLQNDQRNQTRAQLRTQRYDVGAVEVTRGEVLGDGTTAAVLDSYLGVAASPSSVTSPTTLPNSPTLADTGMHAGKLAAVATGILLCSIFTIATKHHRSYRLTR